MVVRRKRPTAALLLILSIGLLFVSSYKGSSDFSCHAPLPMPQTSGHGIAYSVIETSDHSEVITGERQETGSNHSDIFLLCSGERIFGVWEMKVHEKSLDALMEGMHSSVIQRVMEWGRLTFGYSAPIQLDINYGTRPSEQ